MIHALTNEFGQIISSVADGTQPSTTYGTAVTPGTTNTYGSYASVLAGASLTSDAYGLEIFVSSAFTNATDRGMLVTIGFDPAGGTSFSGLGGVTGNEINNLLCSGANNWYSSGGGFGGHRFYFPLFIKSGTSIGAKAQASNGTAGTIRVAVKAYCQPSRPDAIRAGAFVRTFGANTTTTAGTSVTQGTASEGAWTSIGTAADRLWYLETGIAARSATLGTDLSYTDVCVGNSGAPPTHRVVLQDLTFYTTTSETTTKPGPTGAYCDIAVNDVLHARSQASTAQPGFSVALYGVGG